MQVRERVIAKAKTYVGMTSGRKFCEWYNKEKNINWSTTNTPYCAIGVSYVLSELGLSGIFESTASCPSAYRWAVAKGLWKEGRYYGGSYVPKKAELVIYNWTPGSSEKDHIGFVSEIRGGIMYTVEFNTRNTNSGTFGVWEKAYNLDSQYIRGFITLNYPDKDEPKTYTVQGNTLAEIAIKYGVSEENLAKANNLKVAQSLIVGQVLKIPDKKSPAYDAWAGEVTAGSLNVRTWAGENFPKIKSWPQLSRGNHVLVLGEETAGDGDRWYKIEIAQTYIGFVHSMWIKRL